MAQRAYARQPAMRSSAGSSTPAHWVLLAIGAGGRLLFAITFVVEGLERPGYDSLVQPLSALSLGPGGWMQITNFIVFGLANIATAFGWRATLAPGLGDARIGSQRT
jgi:hypothetical protein